MSRSNLMRAADVRSVIQTVGECWELGGDARQWRTHYLEKISQIVGADVGVSGEIDGMIAGSLKFIANTEWGFGRGCDPKGLRQAEIETYQRRGEPPEFFTKYHRGYQAQGPFCASRRQLIEDRSWYRSQSYFDFFRSSSIDHHCQTFAVINGTQDSHTGCYLLRALKRPDFSEREKMIVHESNLAIASYVGGRLARYSGSPLEALTPRQRDVVRCALDGDGDKQISLRLNISKHTVNDHLKAIYKRFGVCTRAELAAFMSRRGCGR